MPRASTVALVKRQVRALLASNPAYGHLSPQRQEQMATDLVRIGSYLAQPEGISANRLAGAITAVPTSVEDLLNDVNFPDFVAGLIQGTFHAIVEASIQQMEAYADLVKDVSKTVDRFAAETISDDVSQTWLATTYADYFERDPKSGGLTVRAGIQRREAIRRLSWLPLSYPLKVLDVSSIEKELVPAARRRIAMDRQQLLATMVMMGLR